MWVSHSPNEIRVLPESAAEELIARLKTLRNEGSPGARKLLKVVGCWYRDAAKNLGNTFNLARGEQIFERISVIKYREICGSFYFLHDSINNVITLFAIEFVELKRIGSRLFSNLAYRVQRNQVNQNPKRNNQIKSYIVAALPKEECSMLYVNSFVAGHIYKLNSQGPILKSRQNGDCMIVILNNIMDNYFVSPNVSIIVPIPLDQLFF